MIIFCYFTPDFLQQLLQYIDIAAFQFCNTGDKTIDKLDFKLSIETLLHQFLKQNILSDLLTLLLDYQSPIHNNTAMPPRRKQLKRKQPVRSRGPARPAKKPRPHAPEEDVQISEPHIEELDDKAEPDSEDETPLAGKSYQPTFFRRYIDVVVSFTDD